MDAETHKKITAAIDLAMTHILKKGCDDIFKPPTFAESLELKIMRDRAEEFKKKARGETLKFINSADLTKCRIGSATHTLVVKDGHSFRRVAWIDPFDSVKYLSVCALLFPHIEAARIPKQDRIIHSHRYSDTIEELFDARYDYDSFRARSGELAQEYMGKWKVVTDVANFFDRISNHSLENHLLDVGCNKSHVTLLREMLYFWSGDRRSFGLPVGSDASRIISEAVLIDIDRQLAERRIQFVRYVDDYRIFAPTRGEAYKAVELLTNLLAEEGLALNSRKTTISKIINVDELLPDHGTLHGSSHERVDVEEKKEIRVRQQVSGKTSFSKHYKRPGLEVIANIRKIPRDEILSKLAASDSQLDEENIKLAVKYFIHAEHELSLLGHALERKITAIFYICDALIKEADKFAEDLRASIVRSILDAVDWAAFAYPYQIPLLRLCACAAFKEPVMVRHIVDSHRHKDNLLFFREAIVMGHSGLDRRRLRELVMDVYPNMPNFVKRAIFKTIIDSTTLSPEEKRPLLKNMRQGSNDWFVEQMRLDETEQVAAAA